jgi:SAM-dependent methyltransferase
VVRGPARLDNARVMSPREGHDSVRRSYDEVAEDYRLNLADELAYKPLDRALLSALLEQSEPGSPVADIGCGPGHVGAWMAGQGARAVGIDLSPAMVEIARRDHPEVEFRVGDLLSLPARDEEFAAAVVLYSIIHLDPAELAPAFAEIRRSLRPGAQCLVSFHVGSEVRHRDEWWGHEVDVDFRFFPTDEVVHAIESTGLEVFAELERANYPQEVETRRAYVLAARPGRPRS